MFALKNLLAIVLLITTPHISAQELNAAGNVAGNTKETQSKEAVVTIEPKKEAVVTVNPTSVKKEAVVTVDPTSVKKEAVVEPVKAAVNLQEKTQATTLPKSISTNETAGAVSASSDVQASNQEVITDLEVVEFVLANSVESKEPREVVENFGLDAERGFAFARLNVKTPTEVTFLWYRNGKLVNRFSTQVHPSKKWRTFSSVKMRPGQWKVQLLQNEKVLAEKTFTLEDNLPQSNP